MKSTPTRACKRSVLKESVGSLTVQTNRMHLQQTKVASRATGGPQYYFHDLPVFVKEFIRGHGACPVVLQTPYGIASSSFMAVGRDHKLGKKGKVVRGKVGHDRIQTASGSESIGEAIRF